MASWQQAFDHLLPGTALAMQTTLFKIAGSFIPDALPTVDPLLPMSEQPSTVQCATTEQWWLYTVASTFCFFLAMLGYNWSAAYSRDTKLFWTLLIGRVLVVSGWLLLTDSYPLICWIPEIRTNRQYDFFTKMQGLGFVFFAAVCPLIANKVVPEAVAHVVRELHEETNIDQDKSSGATNTDGDESVAGTGTRSGGTAPPSTRAVSSAGGGGVRRAESDGKAPNERSLLLPESKGGIFAGLAIVLTISTIRDTWRLNSIPDIRKHVIRVLLMVIVYALEAWLGLIMKEETLIWDMLRECYEAVVIWSFYSFLIAFLGGESSAVSLLSTKQAEAHHMFPFKYCLRPWSVSDRTFVTRTKYGVLQYVPLRLATAVAAFICESYGVYDSGQFKTDAGYMWLALVTNASQIWAMYCLVLLYHASIEFIEPIHPFVKFCCVKLVVFFTFWQSVIIAGLVAVGTIGATSEYSTDDISAGVQDFIICIEMFVASIAHSYAFPPLEFHDPTVDAPQGMSGIVKSVFSPADVVHEVTAPVRGAAKAALASGWGLLRNQQLLARQSSQSQLRVAAAGAGPAAADGGSDDPNAGGAATPHDPESLELSSAAVATASGPPAHPFHGSSSTHSSGDVRPGFELDRAVSTSATTSAPATAEWRAV